MNKSFNHKKNYSGRGVSNGKKGFVRTILLVVIALILLKYAYDIDVVGFLSQGKFKELIDKFYDLGSKGWESYKGVILGIWDKILNFTIKI